MFALNPQTTEASNLDAFLEALDGAALILASDSPAVLAHNRQARVLLGSENPRAAELCDEQTAYGLDDLQGRLEAARRQGAGRWPWRLPARDGRGPLDLDLHLAPVPWADGVALLACLRLRDCLERERGLRLRLEQVLGKRVQELDCLYNLLTIMENPELELPQLFQAVVEQLPWGFRHAKVAAAQLSWQGETWRGPGFRETPWCMSLPLTLDGQPRGWLEVVYREARPAADLGPFLLEERVLMEVVAGRLSRLLERRQYQAELTLQRDFARSLLENTRAMVMVLDEDGRVLHYNRSLASLTGVPVDDARLRDFCATFLPPGQADLNRAFFIANGDHSQGNFRVLPLRQAQGGWRQVEWTVQPLRGGWSGMQGWVCTGLDLTPRLMAESERDRLAAVVEQNDDGVAIADLAGRLVYANQAWRDMHQLEGRELPLGPAPFLDPQHLGSEQHARVSARLEQGLSWRGQISLAQDGGRPRVVRTSLAPLRDAQGQVSGYVARQRDVTQENRLRGYLRQAHKMEALGRLAGGIAHDFNNILGAVGGYCELARLASEPGTKQTEFLDHALLACERAKELVRQILSFSRQVEQERRPLDLSLIVRETLKLLRATLPATISIQTHLPPEPARVLADPSQMHQVLMNLCTNAAQAMAQSGGRLEVSITAMELTAEDLEGMADLQPGPHLRLSVSDNGPGMTSEILERIFEPFFTTKPQGQGTGLGLAVVHGIVSGHGGAIRAYSEPGRGATFHVLLPRLTAQEVARPAPERPPLPGGEERILVVDDEPDLVDVITRLLASLGYQVSSFDESAAALRAFRERPDDFDLVLSDLTMPGLTGLDLALAVRQARPAMPVVICTGFSDSVIQEQAREAGVREVILKPLQRRELALAVRRALDGASSS